MGDRLVLLPLVGQLVDRRRLATAGAEPVDADTARQLGDPGADRLVAPEPAQVLVDAREDLLEDVLRVVLREPECLDGDGIDVAGEALDELVPGRLVAGPAACHELRIRQGARHGTIKTHFQAG